MLGSALKTDAKLILQTKTDGPLDFLVADFEQPGKVRGYANFDKADAALADTKGRGDQGALLGNGHLAMTIDPGGGRDRYQGIVALDREPLLAAAHDLFPPVRAAARPSSGWRWRGTTARPRAGRRSRAWHWRAGGLMIQQLPREGGKRELPRARRTT